VKEAPVSAAYDDARQFVGIDLHRRRSVICRTDRDGQVLEAVRIGNDPKLLAEVMGRAGERPEVVLEATYGWYWAADLLTTIGASVHLAHTLGVKAFAYRRVKNDFRDAADLADLLRMGRLPEAWIAPPQVRDLRQLVRHRAKLVAVRSNWECQVHAVLAACGIPVRMSDLFGERGNQLLDHLQLPTTFQARVNSLRRLLVPLDAEIALFSGMTAARLARHPGYRAIQRIDGVGPVLAAVLVGRDRRGQPLPRPRPAGQLGRVDPQASRVRHPRAPRPDHQDGMWDLPGTAVAVAVRRLGLGALEVSMAGVFQELEEVPMAIVGGLDLHRGQLTFDYLDQDTGAVTTGRVAPADRLHLRAWLERFAGGQQVAFALEGCTGWRYVVEELQQAGIAAHLAEPAETAGLRGPKRRAKTDRADARHLRELLGDGRVPESWIPPAHVLEARATIRLYKDLLDERTAWLQRVHATLFHQGVPGIAKLTTPQGAQRQIERLSGEMVPLRQQLAHLSTHQAGRRALRERHYGVGALTSVAIWAELGDCRRFGSSDDAVRHTGLDITVYASDGKRTKGHLARQGPAVLRWALYEAAMYAARPSSPDHPYFKQVKGRLDAQLAILSVARKLARRCYHTLRELDAAALQPTAA
jgi:transposase